MFTGRKQSSGDDNYPHEGGRTPSRNGVPSYDGYRQPEKHQKKPDVVIAELNNQVQQLTKQLEQQDAVYAKQLKELQTSFHSLRLDQAQIGDRLAKFERRAVELKKQQEDFNRDVNGTFEKVRREIINDQEGLARASREVKNRLDALDVDKALIMERLKHLREDLNVGQGQGGSGGAMIHERESAVQRMEVDLKRLQAESRQQGKVLIGTACGAVVMVAYLLAAKV